jgi:hypothetical protein
MKKHTYLTCILIMSVMMIPLLISNSFGFSPTGTLKFTEIYKQKILCSKALGYCDIFDSGKFVITAKISLDGVDTSRFDRSTGFYIYVGNFYYYGMLGDDYAYAPGKKNARISIVSEPDYYNRRVNYMQVQLKWNAKQLTAKITCITPDHEFPIWADYYIYDNDKAIYEETDAYIEFGDDIQLWFDPIIISGKAVTKEVKKKGELFDVSNIKLNGTGTGVHFTVETY